LATSREVVGEQSPLATALQYVKDGVEDLPKIVDPWSSVSFGSWHVRLYVVPFVIGKIRRARSSHTC
jgi:hypothetical protein